jgi:hypothetical protein
MDKDLRGGIIAAFIALFIVILFIVIAGLSACDIRAKKQELELAKIGYCYQRDAFGSYAYRPCDNAFVPKPVESK